MKAFTNNEDSDFNVDNNVNNTSQNKDSLSLGTTHTSYYQVYCH